jgi:predicted dithiol-disulfide oxidoreductase (DUF899 family)
MAPVEFNFRGPEELKAHYMGDVFHTYSVYARGTEWLGGSYAFLDLTVLGRQEDWEEPKGRSDNARGAIPDFSA